MSPERKKPPLITQAIQETTQAVEKSAVNKFVTLLLPIIELRTAKRMTPELPEGFKDVFREKMKDGNIIPIVVSSHQSHADLITIAVVSKLLTNLANETGGHRLKGFLLPFAASLRTGHQGLLLQEFLIQAEKNYLPKYFVRLADYVRQKDVIKYGMRSNRIAFMNKLIKSIKEGYGVYDLPEGSVESGRLKDRGNGNEIRGMQKINCENLNVIIQTAIIQGKKPFLIPVGSSGTSKMVDSNPDRTGRPANRIMLKEIIALFAGHINTKVGMPIGYEGMVRELEKQGREPTPENMADFLGRKIAELLPANERGVYA